MKGLGALPLPKPAKPAVDAQPLTEKEAKDLHPKMVDALQQVFKYVDMGITYTNKEQAEAYIWQTIDPEDCGIIAAALIDVGKRNKVVATGVRKVVQSYRLLQIGIITAPRFIQSYKHYAEHGGFNFLGGGLFGSKNQGQRPSVPSR